MPKIRGWFPHSGFFKGFRLCWLCKALNSCNFLSKGFVESLSDQSLDSLLLDNSTAVCLVRKQLWWMVHRLTTCLIIWWVLWPSSVNRTDMTIRTRPSGPDGWLSQLCFEEPLLLLKRIGLRFLPWIQFRYIPLFYADWNGDSQIANTAWRPDKSACVALSYSQ